MNYNTIKQSRPLIKFERLTTIIMLLHQIHTVTTSNPIPKVC
jgi:hypothetical protein